MIIKEERIGGQRLILGDCLKVMPLLQFDCILMDPPYGISYSPGSGGGGIVRKDGSRYAKRFTGKDLVIGDNQPFNPAPFLNWPCITWGANYYADKLPPSSNWLIWDKRRGTLTNDFADCEMAWTNLGGPARVLPHMWNGMLRDSERGVTRVHPTQKAIAVMEWCIGFLPNGVILEPFMGSGTTLVACQRMGRSGIGVELDEEYWRIACKRVDEATRQPDMFIAPAPKATQEAFEI